MTEPTSTPAIELLPAARLQALPQLDGLPRLAPLSEVAAAFAMPRDTLLRILKDAPTPRVFEIGRSKLVDLDWLREWLESRRMESAEDGARKVAIAKAVVSIRRANPFARNAPSSKKGPAR